MILLVNKTSCTSHIILYILSSSSSPVKNLFIKLFFSKNNKIPQLNQFEQHSLFYFKYNFSYSRRQNMSLKNIFQTLRKYFGDLFDRKI